MDCYVKMKNVDLYYPSTMYNARTLKQEIFSKLRFEKTKENLEDVHALRNFNLEIHDGERVGVIGFNGAGKSTLLKALGGVYPIKNGTIETKGEIRSMFELTLGFDMESTGRENIMYRGLMLGGTPKEVKEKEQEIIDFAELGEFIDYPIRAYSSGMLVRLAFAISTSVRGDILLVDEVLSAGDINFQKKARQRMLNVMDNAKILVLVLHDMAAIEEICNRTILIKQGEIIADGKPSEIIKEYYKYMK
ncbi:ABC transporter ATP-binding protein [Anaerosporobacter sp.]|uniref:ABC transporter ATP-binding protein n=1 Tax=Anaerosporobacter sp. TaxID=1872529 RepID=UPI00286F3769|nr:ABC transporter ATP-binding protein [Anaerosporobacter sp.]